MPITGTWGADNRYMLIIGILRYAYLSIYRPIDGECDSEMSSDVKIFQGMSCLVSANVQISGDSAR